MTQKASWTRKEWEAWPARKRARAMNSLSGFKSATLVGTSDTDGVNNLSIVSSVVHLGSSPAQMGVVLRPPGADAHTYKNIKATGQCTFSHVHADWLEKAHQCSARYPADVSEFEEVGLTPYKKTMEEGRTAWKAPAVAEASIRMGLTLVEDIALPNGCRFLVLAVEWAQVEGTAWRGDGYLDIAQAGTVTISGLDGYHRAESLGRWSYAQPGVEVQRLEDEQRGWRDEESVH